MSSPLRRIYDADLFKSTTFYLYGYAFARTLAATTYDSTNRPDLSTRVQ